MTGGTMTWVAARLWPLHLWGWSFLVRCALLRLAVVLSAPVLLMHLGHGIAALIAFVVVAIWPWPFRLHLSDDGLHVRYGFVETSIQLADIERVSLDPDPRIGTFGRREPVLRITRRGASALFILSQLETLKRLHRDLEDRLRSFNSWSSSPAAPRV